MAPVEKRQSDICSLRGKQFFGFIFQAMAVPGVWENMNVLCGCLSSFSHSLQVFLKSMYLNYYKSKFLAYLDQMNSVGEYVREFEIRHLNRGSSFAEFHAKESDYVKVILILHSALTLVSTSAYFLPNIYFSVAHLDEVAIQLTPIVIYTPININWTPLFQLIVLLLTICFYLNNLKTVVIDGSILGLVSFNISHYKYQKMVLQSVLDKYFLQKDLNEKEVDEFDRKRRNAVIRDWIIGQQMLLRATRQFQNLMSSFLLLEFAYILIHTCVPAFVITSTFSWTVPQKMAVFFIAGGGLMELLLLSRAGDLFSEAWESMDSDLFEPILLGPQEKWLTFVFAMVKLRVKTTFKLNTLELYPLACSTFGTILRLIASHYMTLNQMQMLKRGKLNQLTNTI